VFFLLLLSFYATILRGLVTCLFYSLLYIYIFSHYCFCFGSIYCWKGHNFFSVFGYFSWTFSIFPCFWIKNEKILSLTLISNSIREKKKGGFYPKINQKKHHWVGAKYEYFLRPIPFAGRNKEKRNPIDCIYNILFLGR